MIILNTDLLSEEEIIKKASEVLKEGGIIIYPTETTYGMGVDATNDKAIEKLLKYKEKREGKAISIAVSDLEMAKEYAEINETAQNLYENFLPGPITVISKSKGKVSKIVESEIKTLGIRVPNYKLILNLIKYYKTPITATSANANNSRRPYKITDILDNISEKQKLLIDLIIDAGELPHNNPSTVIDTVSGEIQTLRLGDNRFDLSKQIKTFSEDETVELGYKLGRHLYEMNGNKATVIAIQGDLGAGKTQFTRGIAKGFNIPNIIKSPTFILMNEYNFKSKTNENLYFYHIDTYRMNEGNELLQLGYEKMITTPNVIVIEWANRIIPILDQYKENVDFIWLKFESISENNRIIYHNLNIF